MAILQKRAFINSAAIDAFITEFAPRHITAIDAVAGFREIVGVVTVFRLRQEKAQVDVFGSKKVIAVRGVFHRTRMDRIVRAGKNKFAEFRIKIHTLEKLRSEAAGLVGFPPAISTARRTFVQLWTPALDLPRWPPRPIF